MANKDDRPYLAKWINIECGTEWTVYDCKEIVNG